MCRAPFAEWLAAAGRVAVVVVAEAVAVVAVVVVVGTVVATMAVSVVALVVGLLFPSVWLWFVGGSSGCCAVVA